MQLLEIIQKKKSYDIYEIVKTILNIIKFMIQEDVIFIKHK